MAKEAPTTEKPKKFKLATIALSLLQSVLLIALIVFVIAGFGTRIPALARLGFNFFSVISGSMEPTIPTGSLISVGKYKLEDLKEGDIVTFQVRPAQGGTPAVVTHRIAKVEKKEEVKVIPNGDKTEEKTVMTYTFTTKGDANSSEDAGKLNSTDIIGLYKGHVPRLGYVTSFSQTPKGFVTMIILPAALLILWEVASIVMYFKKHFEQKAASEVEMLRAELAEAKSVKTKTKKK